jgi:hypothetical protein
MKSLFNEETSREFISRINKLTPDTPAHWGKMNVGQMLHHCQKTLLIASGELIPKINPVVKFLFGKAARRQLLRDPQFKREIPTFPEGKIVDKKDFEEEKKKLISLIERYQQNGVSGLTKSRTRSLGRLSLPSGISSR